MNVEMFLSSFKRGFAKDLITAVLDELTTANSTTNIII